jgi:hypothetical protein
MLDGPSENLLRAILHTLAYADVFDYPLTLAEVHRYLTGVRASLREVAQMLDEMTMADGPLARLDGYYTLRGRASLVATRRQRAADSGRLWRKAARYGLILAGLPFVRMIAVTGSLAMNNADRGRDMDYMLVTCAKRLWICHVLMLPVVALARLEGTRLCLNYLVTENALELPDHSLYAAHELTQMVPVAGRDIYDEMRRLNPWADAFLPNAQGSPPGRNAAMAGEGRLRRALEFVLSRLPLDWLGRWEMDRVVRKAARRSLDSSEVCFTADVCKGHVDRHGRRTELALRERLRRLEPSEVAA